MSGDQVNGMSRSEWESAKAAYNAEKNRAWNSPEASALRARIKRGEIR